MRAGRMLEISLWKSENQACRSVLAWQFGLGESSNFFGSNIRIRCLK